MTGELHEECGVFGIFGGDGTDVASACYYGLYALQHRGQESCGIAVNDGGALTCDKDVGLVNDVFTKERLEELGKGGIAIGHVRYGSTGRPRLNAQPMVVNHIKGAMAIAHNGSLVNSGQLREQLELNGSIFHTTSDAEVISYIITRERLRRSSIEEAVDAAMDVLSGAYSLVIMSATKLIAARDPLGFRPLCIGKTGAGSYVVASESCALDSVGATLLRDVMPGEVVVIDKDGLRSITGHCVEGKKALCAFEFIYFARPDSVIDGSSVHIARQRAGAFLALEHPVQADVALGVPDSGIDAAIGYAKQSGIAYDIGFIKNKYIGRTFIQPGQSDREDKVRIKLNVVSDVVRDKRVIMIDDSIVRGTTSGRIVRLLRDAGAREVHMRVSAPPFRNPCYFGTDIGSRDNLIACKHSVAEIADIIGVDSLGYLSTAHVGLLADRTQSGFCDACFTGNYPVKGCPGACKNTFERKFKDQKREE
jgi:amidophosphoribosyltransferase